MTRTIAAAMIMTGCLLTACDSPGSTAPKGCLDGLVCYCVRARIIDAETLESLAGVEAAVVLEPGDSFGQGGDMWPSDEDGWVTPCTCKMFGGCGTVGRIDYDVPELPDPERVELVLHPSFQGCEQRFTIELGPETMTVTDDSSYHYEIELTEPLAADQCKVIALKLTGIFELVADGDPAEASFLVDLATEKPADSASGARMFIDPEDLEVAGVEAPQTLTAAVAIYVGAADSPDPCDDSENVGSFTVFFDGTDVTSEVSELELSGTALERVVSGRFTVCMVASGDIDATVTVDHLGVRYVHP